MRSSFKELFKSKQDAVVVEIGVDRGDNALDMVNRCKELHLVDVADRARSKFNGFNGKVTFHQMWSVEAARKFPDCYFDYVYIDADHSYHEVTKDIMAWYPKVKVGGMLAGHDYNHIDGVTPAVNEFVAQYNYRLFLGEPEDNDDTDWWIYKKEE